jgi:hypothetical protein
VHSTAPRGELTSAWACVSVLCVWQRFSFPVLTKALPPQEVVPEQEDDAAAGITGGATGTTASAVGAQKRLSLSGVQSRRSSVGGAVTSRTAAGGGGATSRGRRHSHVLEVEQFSGAEGLIPAAMETMPMVAQAREVEAAGIECVDGDIHVSVEGGDACD